MEKNCGRCNLNFECKNDDIAQCQCNSIELSIEDRNLIATKYNDCLCINCLKELKADNHKINTSES